jgi:transcriptional regulator with XRE-family HTH domain
VSVGKKIADIIEQKGLTQKEVAEKAGIKPQTLNNIITRDSSRADVQIFLKICDALDVPASIFRDEALVEFYQDHPNAEPIMPTNTQFLTRRQKRIVELFNDLTDEQQDNLIGRAEMLAELNEQEYKKQENA